MTEKEKKQAVILTLLILVLGASVFVMQMRLKAQKERLNQNSNSTSVASSGSSTAYVPSGSASLATSGNSMTASSSGGSLSSSSNLNTPVSNKVENDSDDSDSGSSTSSGASMTTASVQAFYKTRQTLSLNINNTLFKMTPKVNKESQEIEAAQVQANQNMIENAITQAVNQIKFSGYYQSGNNMVFMLMYNNQNYTYTNSGQLSVSANGQNYSVNLSLTPSNDLLITNSTYGIAVTKSM